VSEAVLSFLTTWLLLTFVVCCVVSAALQILAWSRHAKEGAPVSIRALWRPEGHFDAVGLRQILIARRLLLVGGVAYLTLGLVYVIEMVFGS
jgi:hypothetical protein